MKKNRTRDRASRHRQGDRAGKGPRRLDIPRELYPIPPPAGQSPRRPAQTICADVSDAQAVCAMFEKIGPVDLLVNNAGVAVYGLLTDLDPAVWQRLFDVNVDGHDNCCRCASPMVHEKAGHHQPRLHPRQAGRLVRVAYSATKGAVVAFTNMHWPRNSARPASASTALPPAASTRT